MISTIWSIIYAIGNMVDRLARSVGPSFRWIRLDVVSQKIMLL